MLQGLTYADTTLKPPGPRTPWAKGLEKRGVHTRANKHSPPQRPPHAGYALNMPFARGEGLLKETDEEIRQASLTHQCTKTLDNTFKNKQQYPSTERNTNQDPQKARRRRSHVRYAGINMPLLTFEPPYAA